MSVLVLGGTGFVGRNVVQRLHERGASAVTVHRGQTNIELPSSVIIQNADRSDANRIRALARKFNVRTVIDLLALTEADTRPVLNALAGIIDRYVLVSSGDVYRNYGGLIRRESAEPIHGPLSEDAPLRHSRFPYRGDVARDASDPQKTFDDYDKLPIEDAVRAQTRFDWTILRLAMIYGPGDSQRRFGWFVRQLEDDGATVAIDRRAAAWRSTHGYVENVAEGIALAALHSNAVRRTFNLGDADAPTQAEWVGKLADVMGRKAHILEAEPTDQAALFGFADQLDLDFPLVLDTTRIRDDLGYREPVSEDEALRRTIEDELTRGWPQGSE